MSVRKAHNSGRNHLRNVVDYYQQIGQEKAQSVIDSITASYHDQGEQAPTMLPPGAFPPPFGAPGPGGMPPLPFGIPPPGAPGAPQIPLPGPGGFPAGLPFPPPFNTGAPPPGDFPVPPPGMPQGMIPPPGSGGPNLPFPPPAPGGFASMPPGMAPPAPGGSQAPSGPRGLESYPPPGGDHSSGMDQRW